MATHTVELSGCSPVPLAGYLKALGVFRTVATQVDAHCAAWWDRDVFHLRSSLNRDALLSFFLNDYSPTPLVGPWGARSGFYQGQSEKSAREALDTICKSEAMRLRNFRHAVITTRRILATNGVNEKPDAGEPKNSLMRLLRAELPDSMLDWLDCVYVLLNDGIAYPPILGTGGNEGSGSYTSGFSQAVVDVIVNRQWDHACAAALFDVLEHGVTTAITPGHFDPGATGGANAGSGSSGRTALNPWALLWLMEGTLSFASSCSKRSGSHSREAPAFPFSVSAAGVGYGSAALSDESSRRSELWLPIWDTPATYMEVFAVFTEGRVTVERRPAKTATDFARSVGSLGTDRGINEFERYGFQLRNGDLSNFSVPLGRYHAQQSAVVTLLRGLDRDAWLDRFRRAATGQHAPGRATSALRRLESAILEACQHPNGTAVQRILIALSEAEAAIAISPKLREGDFPVPPVPLLPPPWLNGAYDPSAPDACEFRLAAALASLGTDRNDPLGAFRRHVEPIDYPRLNGTTRRSVWTKHADDPAIVWTGANLVRNMNAVLHRRLIDSVRSEPSESGAALHGRCPGVPGDVFRFVERDVDDEQIEYLTRGLMLLDWEAVRRSDIPWRHTANEPVPSAAYCLLKLCFLPHKIPASDGSQVEVKLMPQIARRAIAGDLAGATELASQRLYASGFNPAVDLIGGDRDTAQRTAAAMLFPLDHSDKQKRSVVTLIRDRVLRHESSTGLDGRENSMEFPAHASD